MRALAPIAASILVGFIGLVTTPACNALVGNDVPTLRDTTANVVDLDASVTIPPAVVCAPHEKICFDTCVEKLSSGFGCADEGSCDVCPIPDHTTPTCNGGACGSACKKGYENCDTSNPDCETDLANPKTCGKCNGVCPLVAPFCTPSGDTFVCSANCPPGTEPCGVLNQCFDHQTSVLHCKTCGNKCPEPLHSTASCVDATCGFKCDSGFHTCGNACKSDADATACGVGCTPCPIPANATATCSLGVCGAVCKPGWADCDGTMKNGCETNTTNNDSNCGACKNNCDFLKTRFRDSCCVASKCTTSCGR